MHILLKIDRRVYNTSKKGRSIDSWKVAEVYGVYQVVVDV